MTFSFFVREKWKLFVWNIGSTYSPLSIIRGGKRNGKGKKQRRIFWTTPNLLLFFCNWLFNEIVILLKSLSFLPTSLKLVVEPVICNWSCDLMNVGSFLLTRGCQKLECCSVISLLLGASWIEMSVCVHARICGNSFCNFLLQLVWLFIVLFWIYIDDRAKERKTDILVYESNDPPNLRTASSKYYKKLMWDSVHMCVKDGALVLFVLVATGLIVAYLVNFNLFWWSLFYLVSWYNGIVRISIYYVSFFEY